MTVSRSRRARTDRRRVWLAVGATVIGGAGLATAAVVCGTVFEGRAGGVGHGKTLYSALPGIRTAAGQSRYTTR
ncbi:hypothetical protein ACFY2M_12140 [Streptomyces sp. NPDC001276]|uniref:hypothetical protein n=1 Tax=Streptomyces sp. NPDC001276 TaxID=3364555 RepID=UPI0036A81AC9